MQLMFDGTGKKGFRHVEEKILSEWGLKFFSFFIFQFQSINSYFQKCFSIKSLQQNGFCLFLKTTTTTTKIKQNKQQNNKKNPNTIKL